jgi:hypothetical protein
MKTSLILAGKKILLVEDVEFNVMVAQRMLRNWNAEVDLIREWRDCGREGEAKPLRFNFNGHPDASNGRVHCNQSIFRKINKQIPIIALNCIGDNHRYRGQRRYKLE